MKKYGLLLLSFALVSLALAACGEAETEYHCCIDGAYYECPDSDALNQCGQDRDPGACDRDSFEDDQCED